MRRRTKVAIAGISLAGFVAFFFFVPVIPANHSYSWETACPNPSQLCSTGDGSLLFSGSGSFTYLVFGIGGWWNAQSGYHVFDSYSSNQVFNP
jgi:hypothetical protein